MFWCSTSSFATTNAPSKSDKSLQSSSSIHGNGYGVAIKKKARVTTTKAIRIQGAIIAIQLKIKISMLIGVCLHELFMVILFSRGPVFNVHFLLVLTFPLQVIIHLKGL